MARKMSKAAYDYVIDTIREYGSMSTDDVVELVRPHYDFDPKAARERELRRYVGQIVRGLRDDVGTRVAFLEKTKSEIVNLDTCKEPTKVAAVKDQLHKQAAGSYRSYRKAVKRQFELAGQTSLFNEAALLLDLIG